MNTDLVMNLHVDFFDIGRLVETLDKRLEGQGVSISPLTPEEIRWYEEFIAGFLGRTIQSKGRYGLTHTIDHYVPNRERPFGRIEIEKSILDEHDFDYEKLRLNTFMPIRLRGRDIVIPPTRVDIFVVGFDEEYDTGYGVSRKDKHDQVKNLLPTAWFLKPEVAEYLMKHAKLQ